MTIPKYKFDMGLTGRTIQTEFDTVKYKQLACRSDLALKVEKHWHEWVDRVCNAPWYKYYRDTTIYKKDGYSPVDGVLHEQGEIAAKIFSTAVWGFGVENWRPGCQEAITAIGTLRGKKDLKNMQYARYGLDDNIYRGLGVYVPSELGELDRWLQSLE